MRLQALCFQELSFSRLRSIMSSTFNSHFPCFLSSYPSLSWNRCIYQSSFMCPSHRHTMSVPLQRLQRCHFYWSSHMFDSDLILLRDSTHPSRHPHHIHLQSPFLAFRGCPCLCTVHEYWPYHCSVYISFYVSQVSFKICHKVKQIVGNFRAQLDNLCQHPLPLNV